MIQFKNVNIVNYRKNALWQYESKLRKSPGFSGIIYMYKNKTNGKVYIGQTTSPYRRHKSHMRSMFCKNEYNTIFHNAIAKYGEDGFDYFILKELNCNNYECLKDNMDKYEKQFIKEFKSTNRNIGYNIKEGGTKTPFKKSKRSISVHKFTQDGEYIESFKTREEAARSVNGVSNVIKNACKTNGVAYGYRWSTTKEKIVIPEKEMIYQYTNDCKLITKYNTLLEAESLTGISCASISKAIIDKYRVAGGFYWRKEKIEEFSYDDFPNAVSQYDANGNFITWFHNVNDAVKAVNASGSSAICAAIKRNTLYHGYLWRKEKLDKIDPFENRDVCNIAIEAVFPDGSIKKYSSIKAASLDTRVSTNSIRRAFSGLNTNTNGFVFRRLGKLTSIKNESLICVEDVSNKTPVKSNKDDKKVDQYSVKGEYIKTFDTIKEAEKSIGGLKISNAIKRHIKAGGYYWVLYGQDFPVDIVEKNNKKAVYQYDKEGNYIAEHQSLLDAARAVGMTAGNHIRECTKDHWRMAKGYYWRKEKLDKIDVKHD